MSFVAIADTDEDMNFRRAKRHRADFRPPPSGARSDDEADAAMQSSPGRSQRGHSDVPFTDQTDDDPYEVLILAMGLLIYNIRTFQILLFSNMLQKCDFFYICPLQMYSFYLILLYLVEV